MDCEFLLDFLISFHFFASCLCCIMFLNLYLFKLFSVCVLICKMKKPGARVLYLGAASGTTVSHVSDIVGPVCNLYEIVVFT